MQTVWIKTSWPFQAPSFTLTTSSSFFTSVPTIDTMRANWILEQMVKIKRPVLLVGESGTSKTATIHNFLKNLDADKRVSLQSNHACVCLICHWSLNVFPSVSRLLWSSTFHPERLQWTCREIWRPVWRKGPKTPTGLQWGRDCWFLWMTWICQRYYKLL